MSPHRFLFSEIFEVVPSSHDAFDTALADLHASLRTRPSCLALDKTVRVDGCTSLINVIVWHHWKSKQSYKAARQSSAYTTFLDRVRRFCATRRSVVSHPIVSELAYQVHSGEPIGNLSPPSSAEGDVCVAAEEAVSRWDRRRFIGAIPRVFADEAGSSGSSASSSATATEEVMSETGASVLSAGVNEDEEGITTASSSAGDPSSGAGLHTASSPAAGPDGARRDVGVKEELAATLLTTGWLSELAEIEQKWRRRTRPREDGWDGGVDEQWLLDMILA